MLVPTHEPADDGLLPPLFLAVGPVTNFLMLGVPGHLPFTGEAAMPVKAPVATPATEGIALVLDRRPELAAALWIPAVVPELVGSGLRMLLVF